MKWPFVCGHAELPAVVAQGLAPESAAQSLHIPSPTATTIKYDNITGSQYNNDIIIINLNVYRNYMLKGKLPWKKLFP